MGSLWKWHLLLYWTGETIETIHFISITSPSGNSSLCKNDTIWAISPTHLFAIPRKNSAQQIEFATFNNDARCIFVDHSNNMDREAGGSISYLLHATLPLITILMRRQIIWWSNTQHHWRQLSIWIGTFRGLDCYHPQTDSWSHYIGIRRLS